jgi:hypothetical protein
MTPDTALATDPSRPATRPMTRRTVLRTALASTMIAAAAVTVAPASPASAAPNDPISRADVISRAQNWMDRNIQYSQSGTATGPDGVYSWRRDCSGFVSMALKLGPTGLSAPNTNALATSTYSFGISRANLKAGDYLVDPGNHVVLFQKWANADHTQFWLYEESNPTTDMEHRVANLSSYAGYLARRANNIRD